MEMESESPYPEPSVIGQTVSHYRILERLGAGGMGVVYTAEDTRLKRTVALKFLPPELTSDPGAKERFTHEAQAASALQHTNICVVHDIDETPDGHLFIVMEYMEGETLRAKIDRGPLAIDEALDITIQIARALSKAHAGGIIHRDIKPANIFLTDDGTAKLLDFGLAKLTGRTMLTKAGSTMGTLAYMSPEQLRGTAVDHRTDIWALGAVLYEMLSGQQPFKGEYDPAILYAILDIEPEPIASRRPEVPGALGDVLSRSLSKDTAQRYQDIETLLGELAAIRGGGVHPAFHRTPNGVLHRPRWPLLAGGTAMVCGILITILTVTRSTNTVSSIHSLAVLPFRHTATTLADTVFAEGMTDALSTELSKLRALVVRSSRSAMRYKDSDKSLSAIAQELNVDALIDGSTQVSGNSVRVSVNLINANPEQQIWGENYTKNLEDINALQSTVAQAIAREIKIVLTPEEQSRLARQQPVNPEAYQACVYGRWYWNKWTPEGFQTALKYFREAAQKDPSYAPAYAGIADVYATLWYNGTVPFDSVEPHWRPAANKAMELDARMAEGHVSVAATRLVYDWDWSGAGEQLRHALFLNPSYATGHQWYALFLSALGRHDSALSEIRLAQDLDPLSVVIAATAGWVCIYARHYDQAIAQFQKALTLDSLCAPAHSGLGEIYEMQGRNEEALQEYLRVARISGGSFATLGGGVADPVPRLRAAYRSGGWRGYWWEQLAMLEDRARTSYVSSFHIAAVCARLQRKDDAFRWLQRSYQERSTNLLFGTVDPNMDNLNDDPRYRALMQRIGLTVGR